MNSTNSPVIDVRKGAIVECGDRKYVITNYVEADRILCREMASGAMVTLKIGNLNKPRSADAVSLTPRNEVDLEAVTTEEWAVAKQRAQIVEPLLEGLPYGEAKYREIAQANSVSLATLYRWAGAYRNSGYLLSSLLLTKRSGGRGKSRLPEEIEAIIGDYLNNEFLTLQKPSSAEAVRRIRERCMTANVKPPVANTVRLRIAWMAGREKLSKREGEAAAERKHNASKGSIPDAKWPLSLVQIDHTLLPVIIVDDKHRSPISRAWITLAIDVFSRVCLGMYLSLDPPSAMSVGMCISRCILLKDKWLRELNVSENATWPFYGVMDVLHADNAKEFRGNTLMVACNEYHIDLQWRPVKNPHYGAHIERLMGTVTTWLKAVKGATFSGPKEKGEYNAEENARMTFDEIEKWLVLKFAEYHKSVHSGIGTTPAQKWREGIFDGNATTPPRGLPPVRIDEDKVRFDFLPIIERTVQADGVAIDDIKYFDDVLRPWIGATDLKHPREARQHRFRRDPRDISEIYFHDPKLERRFTIRSRLPPLSIWEWRNGKAEAKKKGISKDNELAIYQLISEQRALENAAAEKSKAARRAAQQRKHHEKSRANPIATVNRRPRSHAPEVPPDYDPNTIMPIPEE